MRWKRLIIIVLIPLAIGVSCTSSQGTQLDKSTVEVGEPGHPTVIPTWTPTVIPSPTPTEIPPTPTPIPSPDELLVKSHRALENGRYDEAIDKLQLILDSGNLALVEEARVMLGRSHMLLEQYEQSVDFLEPLTNETTDEDIRKEAQFWIAQSYQELDQTTEAIEAYEQYLQLDNTLSGYVLRWVANLHLRAGNTISAVNAYEEAVSHDMLLDISIDTRERLAEAHVAAGDLDAALDQYQQIMTMTSDPLVLGRVEYQNGYLLILNRQYAEGIAHYQTAVEAYPEAFESYLALVELVDAGYPIDDLSRGMVDYYADACEPAIAAFYRHFDQDPYGHPADGHWYAAKCYVSLGQRDSAILELATLLDTHPGDPLWAEAAIEKGDLELRQGYIQDAVDTFNRLPEEYPGHHLAPFAMKRAAQIDERFGDRDKGYDRYLDLIELYPESDETPFAMFRAGLIDWLRGDQNEALGRFEEVVLRWPNSEWSDAADLWQVKMGQEMPDSWMISHSHESFSDFPTYYALRTADELQQMEMFSSASTRVNLTYGTTDERLEAERWLAGILALSDDKSLSELDDSITSDPRWERGTRLWELGMVTLGSRELNEVRREYYNNMLSMYQMALAFRDMGMYRESILAAARVISLSPEKNPLEVPVFIARMSYPLYYSDLIVEAAEEYEIDPLVLFALVRQESLFQSYAQSWAAAQGLMQVIPSTGEYIASSRGILDYVTKDLYLPHVSVDFGVYYLAHQIAAFDGNIAMALAAYNGGPGNAQRWKEVSGPDTDLFVESITFREPRLYIQRIYLHYWVYRNLYTDPVGAE